MASRTFACIYIGKEEEMNVANATLNHNLEYFYFYNDKEIPR